jgi:hypothetical protein
MDGCDWTLYLREKVRYCYFFPFKLTHQLQAGATHLDGLTYFWYGNWFLSGGRECWQIITTPNSTWIPQSYSLYRDVRLRQDGLLGCEDPILWPQLYNEALPHLACISFGGSDDSNADFLRQKAIKSRSREILDGVKHGYATFTRKNGREHHKRLNIITSQLEIAFESIARFQGTYLELTFRLAIIRRLYLEFKAYNHYHELSEVHEFSMDTHPVNSSLVGTITTDETVCYRFHRMGVPVWLVRPLTQNSGTPCRLIKERFPLSLQEGTTPPSGAKLILACVPNVRPIFEGAYDDPAYLVRIADWVRDCFRTNLGGDHPLYSFFASYQRKPRAASVPNVGASNKRKIERSEDGRIAKAPKKTKGRPADGAYHRKTL